ncbi:GspH/FimT family protein [Hahella sp. KA22]|uniref:GspH/FimT family protein n=1 Tax=Hahella sp. KA22 TaxID=1628392 RepID=UPI00351A3269
MWADANGDGAYDAGEEIRVYEGVKDSSTLSLNGGGTTIIYRASGFASASANFKLCSSNANVQGRAVTISAAGRVSVAEETCP